MKINRLGPPEFKDGANFEHMDIQRVEFKLAGSDVESMTFSGYGAVFGNVDSYGDVIVKGAFKDTIREAKRSGNWPALLLQHGGWGMNAEDMTPVGIFTELEEDDIGLKFEAKLADIQRGRDAYQLMKMTPRPAITGMSIGYMIKEFSLGTKPDEPRRTIKKVELMEISLVTFPANPKARVQSVKSGLDIRTAEKALRDVGFGQQEAKAILAGGFKSIAVKRDVDDNGELAALIKRNTELLSA